MTAFSRRSAYDEATNEFAEALRARRARGDRIIDLTESNPTCAGIPYDEAPILTAMGTRASLTYEPAPLGLQRAREEIARRVNVDPTRVVLTASTSEAYAYLFKLLCDAGDDALAPAPSYPLLSQLADLESVHLIPYRLRYDGAWHVDLPSARAAMSSRVRAIIAVSPNNPTGSCLDEEELAQLSSLAPVVCDEVFASYLFRRRPKRVACAAAVVTSGLVFSLGGLSKLAALPQMKLGWIVVGGADERVAHAVDRLAWIADAYLSVATPVQHALPALLANAAVSHEAIVQRLARNLDALDRAVQGTVATRLDLEGGWYATLRVPRVRTEAETVLRVLDRGVYVHPGALFDFEDEAHLVVSLLTREVNFDEGIALLLKAL